MATSTQAGSARELVPEPAVQAARWLHSVLPGLATLRSDSRAVRPGDVFVAFPGQTTDGRRYVADALASGAAAVLFEEAGDGTAPDTDGVPARAVAGLQRLAGPIASEFLGRPSERLRVVAVTGTNGKTSTTQWVARGLARLGGSTAVVGTLGCGAVGRLVDTGMTTPDAVGLQSMLAGFVAEGVGTVAIEASSIGIDQGRLNGTYVEVAAFTNLTRDHLDYHGTMQAYAAAKSRLFGWPGVRVAVVNGDDPYSVQMLGALAAAPRDGGEPPYRIVYGMAPWQYGARGDAALLAERVLEDGTGISMTLGGDFGRADLRLHLLGRFNASNALAVAGCWLALGVEFDDVVRGLQLLEPVPGRLQAIESDAGPLVVVDYAHSPDALASVLATLRPIAEARGGRLWCVFGAGGDRDAGKRPMMGLVAERGADLLVVTSDNPRGESPFRIVSDIRAGLTREPVLTELDRAAAIGEAVRQADSADVVLVAGKGHEAYQEIAGVRHPFSDVDVARRALAARSEAIGV
jgi:UDP-N-acetylmuramyl-tripeptide synthetase